MAKLLQRTEDTVSSPTDSLFPDEHAKPEDYEVLYKARKEYLRRSGIAEKKASRLASEYVVEMKESQRITHVLRQLAEEGEI